MSHRLIAVAVFALCLTLSVATAYGQRSVAAPINRASSQSASTRIGLVGGYNTGRYGDPDRLTRVSASGLGRAGRGLSRPNFYGAGWRMGRLAPAALPQAFTLSPPGAIVPTTVSPWAGALRGVPSHDVARAAGLQASMQLSVPLTGIGPTEIRWPNRPYFVPEPTGTAFHEVFGLKPTEPRPLSEVPVPEDGWVGLLERENEEVFQQKRARALEEFKAATPEEEDEDTEDRERLSEAQWALRVVRDLDRDAYIPCLLLAHVALKKHQVAAAITYLTDAVRRRPALFAERPDLASYFGDPKRLERTAREHLRIGDENPSPPNYALQAYCAWVLDDRVRVKDALDKMTAEDLTTEMAPGVSAVRDAMAATLR